MKSTICRRTRTAIPCASFTSRSRRSCCTSLSTRAFAATAIAVATCAPIAIRAATQTFTYPSGGLWSLYGNWNDGFGPVPINGDDAIIGVNGSVTLNISYTSPGLNSLTLDSSGGTALLDQGIGTSMITVGGDIIGNSGGGYYEQTGGSNAAGSRVIVGSQSSGVGIYNISGGTFGVNNGIVVGNAGNGTLDISGSGAVNAAYMYVGFYSGSNSMAQASQSTNTPIDNVNISGGSLSTTGSQIIGYIGFGAVYQTGGSNTVGGTLTLAADPGSAAIYTLDGGALVAATIALNANGVFNQNNGIHGEPNNGTLNATAFNQTGGTVNGFLQNQGTFNYSSGFFNGRLINQGTLALVGTNLFIAGNGIENDSTLNITSGQTITVNGQGLNNQAAIAIQGGTINGSGVLTNNSQLNIVGTIGGTGGLVNNGALGISYSATDTQILLANTGGNANNGTMQLAQGYSLSLAGNSVALANAGIITLASGAVNGAGTLNNNSGGTIQGPGVISASLNNTGGEIDAANGTITLVNLQGNTSGGELLVNDNSEINSLLAFASSGEIILNGNNAVLAGGVITNSGTISGFGRVGNTVSNSGTIRAGGGTLTFTGGSISNTAAGNIEAGTGDTVLFTQGLATNAGTIALSGGTFDNNNNTLVNGATGQIVGSGIISTGGLNNLNEMNFADNAAQVFGTVTNGYVSGGGNPAGKPTPTLMITSNTTTFYGAVINEAGAVIQASGATIRFLGGMTNNGVSNGDPSTISYTTVTEGTTGSENLSAGEKWMVSQDFINNSTQNTIWNTSAATLEFTSGGSHNMAVAGANFGNSSTGYNNNFAWGQLILDSGNSLVLNKGTGLPAGTPGAFYIYGLTLAGGISQIADITGNGVNIYYDPANSANAYLGDKTYALAGGGELAPASTPEPVALAIIALGGLGLLLRRRGSRAGKIEQ